MDICGTLSGRDIDKFKICKFTQSKSEVVHTPGIAECPVSIECKVKQIIPLGGHHIFISKIVAKQIDPRYCDSQGKHKPEDLDPIIYLRPKYFYLSDNTIGHFGYTLKEEK